jgi:hypothetical protein
MVYCFTAPLCAGFFFASGVCLVINALFETSGFWSGDGFCAPAGAAKRGDKD